jgi:hypothetical protein
MNLDVSFISQAFIAALQPLDHNSSRLFVTYFLTRLVWLATHCHLPTSKIQVSVKRPT